jgi:hypothetical protein
MYINILKVLKLSDTTFGLKKCINYARKLISMAVPHMHDLSMPALLTGKMNKKIKSYQKQPSN